MLSGADQKVKALREKKEGIPDASSTALNNDCSLFVFFFFLREKKQCSVLDLQKQNNIKTCGHSGAS